MQTKTNGLKYLKGIITQNVFTYRYFFKCKNCIWQNVCRNSKTFAFNGTFWSWCLTTNCSILLYGEIKHYDWSKLVLYCILWHAKIWLLTSFSWLYNSKTTIAIISKWLRAVAIEIILMTDSNTLFDSRFRLACLARKPECFFKWTISGLFIFSIQLTVNVQYKFVPMFGFKPRTSRVGSYCPTNWATTTAQLFDGKV